MSRNKSKNIDWLIKNFMPFLKKFGMNENNIREYYLKWNKGDKDSIEDYIWFIFNNLLEQNQKQSKDLKGLYERNDLIYREMIHFRRKYEKQRANEIQKLFNFNRANLNLLGISNELYWQFEIITGNSCNACKNLEGVKISLEEGLKNEIIPYDNCDRELGCTCMLGLTAKRDENGMIMFK